MKKLTVSIILLLLCAALALSLASCGGKSTDDDGVLPNVDKSENGADDDGEAATNHNTPATKNPSASAAADALGF